MCLFSRLFYLRAMAKSVGFLLLWIIYGVLIRSPFIKSMSGLWIRTLMLYEK